MSSGSLARRYAKAALLLAVDSGDKNVIGTQLSTFAQHMGESTELTDALTNLALPRPKRKKLAEVIVSKLSITGSTARFIGYLVDKERIVHLPDIARELTVMIDDENNQVDAHVSSAQPLTPGQSTRLQAAIEKITGKQIRLITTVDASLIGGAIARVGDVIYDGSVRNQLERMRNGIGSQNNRGTK